MDVIKKLFPIRDENNQPCTFPTFASQVFFDDGSVLEGKQFGGGGSVDPLPIYPVGSIYLSVNSISPAALFGGTWEQLKDVFLLGAGGNYAVASVGGEAAVRLVGENIPEVPTFCYNNSLPYGIGDTNDLESGFTSAYLSNTTASAAVRAGYQNNTAHNNMPPYYAVNMWQRMA